MRSATAVLREAAQAFPVGSKAVYYSEGEDRQEYTVTEAKRRHYTSNFMLEGSAIVEPNWLAEGDDAVYIRLVDSSGRETDRSASSLKVVGPYMACLEASREFPVGTRVEGRQGRQGVVVHASEYERTKSSFDSYTVVGSSFAHRERFRRGLGGPYIAVKWDSGVVGSAYTNELAKVETPEPEVETLPVVVVNLTIIVNS